MLYPTLVQTLATMNSMHALGVSTAESMPPYAYVLCFSISSASCTRLELAGVKV